MNQNKAMARARVSTLMKIGRGFLGLVFACSRDEHEREQSVQYFINRLARDEEPEFSMITTERICSLIAEAKHGELSLGWLIRITSTLSAECGAFGDVVDSSMLDPLANVVQAYEEAYQAEFHFSLTRSIIARVTQQHVDWFHQAQSKADETAMCSCVQGLLGLLTFQSIEFYNLDPEVVRAVLSKAQPTLVDPDGAAHVAAKLSVLCGAFGDATDPAAPDPLGKIVEAYREGLRLHPGKRLTIAS